MSDIIITPNKGSANAPTIQFSGSANASASIRLEVLPEGQVAFLGKSGSLFSISDNMVGSLMAVSDISGLPILEVFSDDRIIMGKYNKNTLYVSGTNVGVRKVPLNAVLDVSGSVAVTGSLGVAGSILADGGVTASLLGTASYALNALTASYSYSGTSGTSGTSGAGTISGGTANYVARFTDATTLSTGVIYDDATNVGIGTTTPGLYDGEGNDLVVFKAATAGITIAVSDTTSRTSIKFADGTTGSEAYRGGIEYDHGTGLGGTADSMHFRTAAALRMAINGSGNVGIGTVSPSSTLTVATVDTLLKPALGLRQANALGYGYDFDTETALVGRLDLYRVSNNVRTQMMSWRQDTGDVTISSTTAGASNAGALVVQGGISVGNTGSATSYFGGAVTATGTLRATNGNLYTYGESGNATDGILFFNSAANNYIYGSGAQLAIYTAGVQRATISSTGATFAGAVTSTGTLTIGSGSGATLSAGSLNLGADIGLGAGYGIVQGAARVLAFTGGAATFAGAVTVSSTTAGSSGAGALVVAGGISAGQSGQASYFGGSISFPTSTGIISTVNDGRLFLDGSANQSGGSITLYGSAHTSFPAQTFYAANTHVFKTTSNTQQLSLSLTAATFAGAVSANSGIYPYTAGNGSGLITQNGAAGGLYFANQGISTNMRFLVTDGAAASVLALTLSAGTGAATFAGTVTSTQFQSDVYRQQSGDRSLLSFSGVETVLGGGTPGDTTKINANGVQALRIDASLLATFAGDVSAQRLEAVDAAANNRAAAFIRTQNNTTYSSSVLNIQGDRTTTNASYNLISAANAAGTGAFAVRDSGNAVNTNNSYGSISDRKLKENIVDATSKLEKLNQVRIVNFNRIGNEQKQLGVIAQELEQIFPSMIEEVIDRDAEGNDLGTTTKSVKYSVFVPMLIKAVQELTARLAAVEAK